MSAVVSEGVESPLPTPEQLRVARRAKGLEALTKGLKDKSAAEQFIFLSDKAFERNVAQAYRRVPVVGGGECLVICGLFGVKKDADGRTQLGLVFTGDFGSRWLAANPGSAQALADGGNFVSKEEMNKAPPPFVGYDSPMFAALQNFRLFPMPDNGFLSQLCSAACAINNTECALAWKERHGTDMNTLAPHLAHRILVGRFVRKGPGELERAFMKMLWKGFMDKHSVHLASRVFMQRRMGFQNFADVSHNRDLVDWWAASHPRLLTLLSRVSVDTWASKDIDRLETEAMGPSHKFSIFDDDKRPTNQEEVAKLRKQAFQNWPAMSLAQLAKIEPQHLVVLEKWRAAHAPSPRTLQILATILAKEGVYSPFSSKAPPEDAIPALGNTMNAAERSWHGSFKGRCPIRREDVITLYKDWTAGNAPVGEIPFNHPWRAWIQHAALEKSVAAAPAPRGRGRI